MAMYELTVSGFCYDQSMVNRFHYKTPSLGTVVGGAQDLADVFEIDVLTAIRGIQKNDLNQVDWQTIAVRDLYDPTDFGERASIGVSGTNGSLSESLPPFVSVGFRSPRYRTGRNRAYKRFAGVPEERVSGNSYVDTVPVANLSAALKATLIGAITASPFEPTLMFLLNVGGDPPVYELYSTEAAQAANRAPITLMNYYRLTTQRSRIKGHGA